VVDLGYEVLAANNGMQMVSARGRPSWWSKDLPPKGGSYKGHNILA
jgi:hypothetical protein